MALQKQDARTMIRELIDDAALKLWSDALLERLTTITIDHLWGELLSFAPRLTSQLDTITANLQTPGYIRLWLTSDTPAGDLTQRFFRIQSVTRDNNQEYSAVDPKHVVVRNNVVVASDQPNRYLYHIQGKQLWLFPFDLTSDVEVRYSYLPKKFSAYNDTDNVEWPEGFEDAYVFEVAGRAMMKGGREDAQALLQTAANALADLRSYVQRPHGGVIMPYQSMTAQAWGGE